MSLRDMINSAGSKAARYAEEKSEAKEVARVALLEETEKIKEKMEHEKKVAEQKEREARGEANYKVWREAKARLSSKRIEFAKNIINDANPELDEPRVYQVREIYVGKADSIIKPGAFKIEEDIITSPYVVLTPREKAIAEANGAIIGLKGRNAVQKPRGYIEKRNDMNEKEGNYGYSYTPIGFDRIEITEVTENVPQYVEFEICSTQAKKEAVYNLPPEKADEKAVIIIGDEMINISTKMALLCTLDCNEEFTKLPDEERTEITPTNLAEADKKAELTKNDTCAVNELFKKLKGIFKEDRRE